ncbi:MAG: dodecin family protein [Caldilineales bacterium]|nr:dodecin family protein [Caldilineales bacterium]MCW5860431.1 dodecin domain-containing protein [Caldilineales bacterium]
MSSQVAKVIELIGTSEVSWEDAAARAVKAASRSLHGISGIEVRDMTAKVEDGKIVSYRTAVKIVFAVDV